ncbi:MAG: hypothetical protein ACXQTR_01725 [Candidatus Methanospirareceae archaeon]
MARVGTALNRFLKSNESTESVELTADPAGVSTNGTPFTATNMNKIEQGIYDAHVTADDNAGRLDTVEGTAGDNSDRLDVVEGTGTPQGVGTGDSPTFVSIDTGQGANRLYDMNQNLKTTDSPTFEGLTLDGALALIDPVPYSTGSIDPDDSIPLPQGVYVFGYGAYLEMRIWINGGYMVVMNHQGFICSDGVDTRVYNVHGTNTYTFSALKY